ncbi:hypothetical protein [Bifidobacterium sp. UTBIF-78]|uniref:hypothetical protein n=1 Tax=Bifidobacterium sp. UTBIF-78 TaxID=1465263 RepID=UPI0015E28DCF|nr:hypothetical protein [Bifidobacterium sp. UTBIF-78]
MHAHLILKRGIIFDATEGLFSFVVVVVHGPAPFLIAGLLALCLLACLIACASARLHAAKLDCLIA